MTLEDRVLHFRLRVLQRAQELGNVSAACRELGVSRTSFYRWKRRLVAYGVDGLRPRRKAARPGRPPSLSPVQQRAIVALALAWSTWGPQRLSLQLARQGMQVSPSTVWRTLRRVGLGRKEQRLLVLERYSAEKVGLLTERTRRDLKRRKDRHVQASEPGQLVCLDTFYIGKLKGVGKVWQITACDAASSYGWARIIPACDSREAARFLREVVAPECARAGWKLRRVLTDGGSEFKGEFDRACRELKIVHTRTKPRHAWTNGFVERLQGTILREHWRVEFRRRYFTSRAQLQSSLSGYLRFYNDQRPHQGYRTQGRTPSEVFWGVAGRPEEV